MGTYDLAIEARRTAPWTALGTAQRLHRTFPWLDNDPLATPVLPTVRFDVALDDNNRARRGTVPVTVWVDGPAFAEVRQVTVAVSYNDGRTWTDVNLTAADGNWTGRVDHPREAKFMSVRATARDAVGIAVRQKVIRAYTLG